MMVEEGQRIRLVRTNFHAVDELKPGDMGVIKEITRLRNRLGGQRQIWIRFDKGITVALLEGEDVFQILSTKREEVIGLGKLG